MKCLKSRGRYRETIERFNEYLYTIASLISSQQETVRYHEIPGRFSAGGDDLAIAELSAVVNSEDGQAVMATVGRTKRPAVSEMNRRGDGPVVFLEITEVLRHGGHDLPALPVGVPDSLKDVNRCVQFTQYIEIIAVLAENQVSRAGTVRKIEGLPSVDQSALLAVPIVDENLVHAQVVDIDIMPITN